MVLTTRHTYESRQERGSLHPARRRQRPPRACTTERRLSLCLRPRAPLTYEKTIHARRKSYGKRKTYCDQEAMSGILSASSQTEADDMASAHVICPTVITSADDVGSLRRLFAQENHSLGMSASGAAERPHAGRMSERVDTHTHAPDVAGTRWRDNSMGMQEAAGAAETAIRRPRGRRRMAIWRRPLRHK